MFRLPITSGRASDGDPRVVNVNGRSFWIVRMAFNCQPLNALSSGLLRFLANILP